MGPEEAWSVAMALDGHRGFRSVFLLTKAALAPYQSLPMNTRAAYRKKTIDQALAVV